MAIVLGGLTLNPNLIWTDRNQHSDVVYKVDRTISGRQIISSGKNQGGRPITLQATIDQGWLTNDMVNTLQSMADQEAAQFQLTLGVFIAQVMFRHYDAPAVEFESLIPRATPTVDDQHIGVIKLFTII